MHAQAGARMPCGKLERLERHRGREGYGVAYEIAIIHAALGQTEKPARPCAARLDDHSPTLGWLRLDPRMDPLRKAVLLLGSGATALPAMRI